eukprot:1160718-Pelagomonas_calceolata.AAC.7
MSASDSLSIARRVQNQEALIKSFDCWPTFSRPAVSCRARVHVLSFSDALLKEQYDLMLWNSLRFWACKGNSGRHEVVCLRSAVGYCALENGAAQGAAFPEQVGHAGESGAGKLGVLWHTGRIGREYLSSPCPPFWPLASPLVSSSDLAPGCSSLTQLPRIEDLSFPEIRSSNTPGPGLISTSMHTFLQIEEGFAEREEDLAKDLSALATPGSKGILQQGGGQIEGYEVSSNDELGARDTGAQTARWNA